MAHFLYDAIQLRSQSPTFIHIIIIFERQLLWGGHSLRLFILCFSLTGSVFGYERGFNVMSTIIHILSVLIRLTASGYINHRTNMLRMLFISILNDGIYSTDHRCLMTVAGCYSGVHVLLLYHNLLCFEAMIRTSWQFNKKKNFKNEKAHRTTAHCVCVIDST